MGQSPLPRLNSNVASNVMYGTRSGQLTQMANGTSLFYEQVWPHMDMHVSMLLRPNKEQQAANASQRLFST